LLVFWSVTGVTSADTYLDMRRRMCLGDDPKSGAILWNYLLPRPIGPPAGNPTAIRRVRLRSCCRSWRGLRFYISLPHLRPLVGIGVENRFSGGPCGKWLCEMTSTFIIEVLRDARNKRLLRGESGLPRSSVRKHMLFNASQACGRQAAI
jgi:hypothetical protein